MPSFRASKRWIAWMSTSSLRAMLATLDRFDALLPLRLRIEFELLTREVEAVEEIIFARAKARVTMRGPSGAQ